jgi:hypothetical protein
MAAKKPKSNGSDSGKQDSYNKKELAAMKEAYRTAENSQQRRENKSNNKFMGRVTTKKVTNKYTKNVQSPGRAQPKGTQPKGMAAPPRTGPSSGGGGQSSRYSRLTGGGLNKPGR